MRYVVLNSEKTQVDNVIVADEEFIAQHYPEAIFVSDEFRVAPGYLYQDGSFVKPVWVMPEEIIDVEEVTPTPVLEIPVE